MDRQKLNPLFDVRSPEEFKKGHIPGAINIPLFSDEERELIGTLYKQKSPWSAIQKGMEIAIPKSDLIIDQIKSQIKDNTCSLYCWRGGMRSQAVTELLERANITANRLNGGYKAYRRHSEELFSRPMNIRLLGGLTGCGKTEKLHSLQNQKEQILDLEALANHRGSCFGHIGQNQQPTTEHFHNLIAEKLTPINPQKTLWIEDEGRLLGSCHLPESLYKQMRQSPIEMIICSLEDRLERLYRVYGNADPEEWIQAVINLRKKLGSENTKSAIDFIHSHRLKEAAVLVLSHYDKSYLYSHKNRIS